MSKLSRWSRLFSMHRQARQSARGGKRRGQRHQLRCEVLELRRVLATFAVNTTADSIAVNLLTGEDANGTISIRSAIMAANSQPGAHVIDVPFNALSYQLTIDGAAENFAATGDLDIRSSVEINAAPGTVLEAFVIDRVFDVQGIGSLTLNNLSVKGGIAPQGGAIYNRGTLNLQNANIDGTAGEPRAVIGVTVDTTPRNAFGGAIFNAATGQASIINTVIQGVATGSTGLSVPGAPGIRGGHAYGGAIYNLGNLNTFNAQIFGNAYGGHGGDGSNGVNGDDAATGQPATNGQPGLPGGAGGYAYGGVVYNGPAGSVSFTQSIVDGSASGGFGGRGGVGGQGGAASAIDGLDAGLAGVGGNGGLGGVAYGGGIYNAGGEVSFPSGDHGSSRVRSNAFGGGGGAGGAGGLGGSGDLDTVLALAASGTNGGAGGVGGTGGVAYGAGLYTLSGNVGIFQAEISGLVAEITLGAYGGFGGAGGAGGEGGAIYASSGNGNGGTGARGGRGGTAEGGGVYVKGGIVNMINAAIDTYEAFGGSSGASGAGGAATQGQIGATNSGLTGAAGQGGAMSIRGGEVTIRDARLYINRAFGGNGGDAGGGLAAGMGGLAQGGAIFVGSGVLNIELSIIEGNDALGGFGGTALENPVGVVGTAGGMGGNAQGGGLAASGGVVLIETSTFKNNTATAGDGTDGSVGNSLAAPLPGQIGGDGGRGGAASGGALYTTGGSFTVRNVTIHGNRATGGVGGAGGPAQNIDGTLIGPFGTSGGSGTGRGGGSFHTGAGSLLFDSVTVARNEIGSVNGSGAGLYNVGGTVLVHNTLIALNTLAVGNTSNNWDAVGNFSSQGYNIISVRNGTTGFTAVGDRRGLSTSPLDVQLGPLSFDQIPTAAPLFSSIAINAGDPLNFLPFDQLGSARVSRADIGAVEYIPQAS